CRGTRRPHDRHVRLPGQLGKEPSTRYYHLLAPVPLRPVPEHRVTPGHVRTVPAFGADTPVRDDEVAPYNARGVEMWEFVSPAGVLGREHDVLADAEDYMGCEGGEAEGEHIEPVSDGGNPEVGS